MGAIRRQPLVTALTVVTLLLSLLCYPAPHSWADSFSERRALVGLKLFRTLVAADLDITQKTNPAGGLSLALVHVDDASQARDYQPLLQRDFSVLGKTPVDAEVMSLEQLLQSRRPPAAIFVSQELKDPERKALVAFSIKHHTIVFSPYEGDVEAGVLAGLSVQATVKPLINGQTLERGEFHIKPFYLKVAKRYE